jgi:hypothetical protein
MFLNNEITLIPSANPEISRVPINVTANEILSILEGKP